MGDRKVHLDQEPKEEAAGHFPILLLGRGADPGLTRVMLIKGVLVNGTPGVDQGIGLDPQLERGNLEALNLAAVLEIEMQETHVVDPELVKNFLEDPAPIAMIGSESGECLEGPFHDLDHGPVIGEEAIDLVHVPGRDIAKRLIVMGLLTTACAIVVLELVTG